MEPLLEFSGVCHAYKGEAWVVQDATFQVPQLEAVSIVGPNGGGKTTLLKLALGLLKPNRGSIRLLGEAPGTTCDRVGYVPQLSQLDPAFPITAERVVSLGLKGSALSRSQRRKRTHQALERCQAAGLAKQRFGSLSGGQRQRVLIARALAIHPDALFLDEPATGLDVAAQEALYALLAQLRTDLTILTVTHDLNLVEASVSHVLCVDRHVRLHPTKALKSGLQAQLFGPKMALVDHEDCLHTKTTAAALPPEPSQGSDNGCPPS
jgi:zinc transport system ATP-binding protein